MPLKDWWHSEILSCCFYEALNTVKNRLPDYFFSKNTMYIKAPVVLH